MIKEQIGKNGFVMTVLFPLGKKMTNTEVKRKLGAQESKIKILMC